MTDKQIIDILKNIKNHCEQHEGKECDCIFADTKTPSNCQLAKLLKELYYDLPKDWNIEELERIIKQ